MSADIALFFYGVDFKYFMCIDETMFHAMCMLTVFVVTSNSR